MAILDKHKRYQAINAERIRKYLREWYRLNKETVKARSLAWAKNNKHRASERIRRRRAMVLALVHPAANFEQISQIYLKASLVGQSVDHIIPISRGGWHHEDNLQIMPKEINSEKNARLDWSHPSYKTWRDVPEYQVPEHLKNKK